MSQWVMSQTFISELRYIAVLARNNFHYQNITDRKRPVSVVNKLRYFFLRSFAVFIGRPQQNRDRTANESQANRNWIAYAPQPNLNRTSTEPQPNLNRTALEPRPNRDRIVRLFLDSTVCCSAHTVHSCQQYWTIFANKRPSLETTKSVLSVW